MSSLTNELNALKRAERHNTVAESRYWCDQYRQFAERAVQATLSDYEELRAIIDGGSESMTHADAVEWCKRHAESDWKPVKNNS